MWCWLGRVTVELGEAVEALGGCVGDAGQDSGDDLLLPAGERRGEREELGDVIACGSPVVEGEEPVPYLPLAPAARPVPGKRFVMTGPPSD